MSPVWSMAGKDAMLPQPLACLTLMFGHCAQPSSSAMPPEQCQLCSHINQLGGIDSADSVTKLGRGHLLVNGKDSEQRLRAMQHMEQAGDVQLFFMK